MSVAGTGEQLGGVMSPPLSRQLAHFASSVTFADLPADVVEHAKLCLLDTVGCGLFGSTLPWTEILRSTLAGIDGGGRSTVWASGLRLSPPHAALINGAAVHGFELDDLHKESILHPGSVVAPAVLAAADVAEVISGARVVTALVVGYEIGARIGAALGTPHLLQGWHPTGTHGCLAAAAGAAVALGLTARQTQHALGIAGSQSAGLMAAQYSSMVKRFHAGRAAQSGLYSAVLARSGYTGIDGLLEPEYGSYPTTFSPSFDLTDIATDLGERWEVRRVGFKPYSANGSCHPAIELIQELRMAGDFGAPDVSRIVVSASSATVAHVGWPYEPDSVTTAQMNLPYIVAVVVTDGEAFVDQFTADRIRDPILVDLARKVEVNADPEIDAQGPTARHLTRIAVHLADGRVLHGERRSAQGSSQRPLTRAAIHEKYHRLAVKAISIERAQLVEDAIEQIDKFNDHTKLSDALA